MKDVLKELRIKNRYSQELLAKVLGISRQAYMKYESGEVEPSVEVVRRLSKIYNVSYAHLIDNGKVTSSDAHPVQYTITEPSLTAAESSPAYTAPRSSDSVTNLYKNLQYLKQTIAEMELQIKEQMKNQGYDNIAPSSISKSRSFDKDAFFKATGTINMDSTYVDELRENSLT